MHADHISTCVARAVVCAGLLMAAQPARADSSEVTLSGCLVKAADEAGYLVTNGPAEFTGKRNGAGKVSLNAFGATGGFAAVIYWIENKDALTPHIGHFVEVEGELKVDRKDRCQSCRNLTARKTRRAP